MTPMMTPTMMMLTTMETVVMEQFLKLAPLLVRASFASPFLCVLALHALVHALVPIGIKKLKIKQIKKEE